MGKKSEQEACEDFIRYCGITPEQNYLSMYKETSPVLRNLLKFSGEGSAYLGALEKAYLLVFTEKEVLVKRSLDMFKMLPPDKYAEHLMRIPHAEITDFAAYVTEDNNNHVSFRYQGKQYRFYRYARFGLEATFLDENFSNLNFEHFYGLLKK